MADFTRDGARGGSVQPVLLSVNGAGLLEIFPTQYNVKNSCQLIGSPSEKGIKQIDNKVILPTTVQMTGIVKFSERGVFGKIKRTMKQNTLSKLVCVFQSKAGRASNMILENLEEIGESNRYDGIEIRVQLQEFLEHNKVSKQ